MALVEAGIDRNRMGVASRGFLLTDERQLITYHEAGHALSLSLSRALPEAIKRRPIAAPVLCEVMRRRS